MPLLNLFSRGISEAGEWGVYLATSAKYPPSQPRNKVAGMALGEGITRTRGSNGGRSGVYRIDRMGEAVQNKFDQGLEQMREEKLADKKFGMIRWAFGTGL